MNFFTCTIFFLLTSINSNSVNVIEPKEVVPETVYVTAQGSQDNNNSAITIALAGLFIAVIGITLGVVGYTLKKMKEGEKYVKQCRDAAGDVEKTVTDIRSKAYSLNRVTREKPEALFSPLVILAEELVEGLKELHPESKKRDKIVSRLKGKLLFFINYLLFSNQLFTTKGGEFKTTVDNFLAGRGATEEFLGDTINLLKLRLSIERELPPEDRDIAIIEKLSNVLGKLEG